MKNKIDGFEMENASCAHAETDRETYIEAKKME